LAHAGVKAVIVKSVSRIFFRSSVNQGLPILVLPQVVDAYTRGDAVGVDMQEGIVTLGGKEFKFPPLPPKLLEILSSGGLVKWLQAN
jgi:3-isopropylmalate/(R)-2-methylmalate dehydratase large subunit